MILIKINNQYLEILIQTTYLEVINNKKFAT